jgi:hypothetical protein
MMIRVAALCGVTPRIDVLKYCHSKDLAAAIFKMKCKPTSIFRVKWGWRQIGSTKRWYPTTLLHDVTTQKTMTQMLPFINKYDELRTKLACNQEKKLSVRRLPC